MWSRRETGEIGRLYVRRDQPLFMYHVHMYVYLRVEM
nr:hypothetical protein [Tanacetum cinerariifolium]